VCRKCCSLRQCLHRYLLVVNEMNLQMSIPAVATIVMPKVDHEDHLGHVEQEISRVIHSNPGFRNQRPETLSVVASIESAQALWRIGEISQWKSKTARLSALLVRLDSLPMFICRDSLSLQFAAEDCT
jgi:citrate lyase beta subunit